LSEFKIHAKGQYLENGGQKTFMANLVRNDLEILGDNIKTVLDAIGFNPNGVPIIWNAKVQPENIAVLIDFKRIVPRPKEPPVEGWYEWITKNWGTMPYDGYSEGDIFELADNKVSFKFYTKWTPAFPLIETLAKRFRQFKFNFKSWDQTNHRFGEVTWQNGLRTLFVPMFPMKLKSDADEPANDAVTDEMKVTAGQLLRAAVEKCNGTSPDTGPTETTVAGVIASSGRSVAVNFELNDDGSCCLCIEA
jgi:hypothetical protein